MGADGIHRRVLRELVEEIIKTLSLTYNQSWLTGEVPDDWKLAIVMPIHQKDQKKDLGNYRPVSLTSVPGKAMEQIILVPSHGPSRTSRGSDPGSMGSGKAGPA